MVICLWLSTLIFDFLLKGCPLSSFLFSPLTFRLTLASDWENGKSAQWISSGWLGLSQWTPVDPGCQMCLSIGISSRICLLGLWEFVGVDRRCGGGCWAECCPSLGPATHTVFFSIHHCQYTADAGVWWLYLSYGGIAHATCSTWTKSSITHAFDWHSSKTYFVMIPQTFDSVHHGQHGGSLVHLSQRTTQGR